MDKAVHYKEVSLLKSIIVSSLILVPTLSLAEPTTQIDRAKTPAKGKHVRKPDGDPVPGHKNLPLQWEKEQPDIIYQNRQGIRINFNELEKFDLLPQGAVPPNPRYDFKKRSVQ